MKPEFTEAAKRTSVAVVGAGAVGGIVAWALHKAGNDVTLCVRSRVTELRVLTDDREEHASVRIVTEPSGLKPVRWVLVAVKAFDTPGTANWLRALCDERTTVVVLQNGVDGAEQVRAVVPAATAVVPALVYIQAERLAPGHIRLGYGNSLEVAAGPTAQQLAHVFRDGPMEIRPQHDLVKAAWLKLMLNVAVNPLTALTLRRMEVFAEQPIRELALGLMTEAATVANAVGARVTEEDIHRTLEFTAAFSEGNGTSMLYDRLAGRPMEYEALNGAVVRHGRAHGIDTPLNQAMTALLAALQPDSAEDTSPRRHHDRSWPTCRSS